MIRLTMCALVTGCQTVAIPISARAVQAGGGLAVGDGPLSPSGGREARGALPAQRFPTPRACSGAVQCFTHHVSGEFTMKPFPLPLAVLGLSALITDRKSTRLNSSNECATRMPSVAWNNKK